MLDGKEEKSTMYVYLEDGLIIILSYVNKKKSGKKTQCYWQRCIMIATGLEPTTT